jgi:photosystem II stability/assembly factor-like uncharacterized protein
MKTIALFIVFKLLSLTTIAQSGLTTLDLPPGGRYDDIFFVNDSVGWTASGNGKIYNTRDGGVTWQQQFATTHYLRSIEFATEKIGFCGSLDSTLYKTIDGGQTWTDITASIPTRPKGICGLCIPDPSTIYGVGKYSGGACVIRSTDGGNTWSYINMTAYAKGLVDVYFFNTNEGFVTGISDTNGGVLLYTNDGGATWSYKYKTAVAGDYIWKIQTPDNVNFYASVAGMPFTNDSRYLHSADRGATWILITWAETFNYTQGIGFIDSQVGWIGGDQKLFKTIDGGKHWVEDIFQGPLFDRFCRINSKIAYLSGQQVYKYDALSIGNNGNTQPDNIHFLSVTPNPTRNTLKIQPVFKYATFAMLSIYDAGGSFIAQPLNRYVKGGSLTINYDLSAKAAGIYYVILRTNEGMIYKKVVKQ